VKSVTLGLIVGRTRLDTPPQQRTKDTDKIPFLFSLPTLGYFDFMLMRYFEGNEQKLGGSVKPPTPKNSNRDLLSVVPR
jgi:hypothetical protein